MLTLFHAPNSRSTSILALIKEMGVEDRIDIRTVTIRRHNGEGGRDPQNPHPEGKVPYLVNGADHVRERGAIIAYLTDMFPGSGMGRPVGDPQRGAFLSWLFWYQGVAEPVVILKWAGIDSPLANDALRDFDEVVARVAEALKDGPYLLGERYSAADLLVSSLFSFSGFGPETGPVRDWVKRCEDRPSVKAALDKDRA